jgi:hypothetical protein
MVLNTSDWKTVIDNGVFKGFLAQVIGTGQLVFLGYGLGDPDFTHAWDDLLRDRVFRAPALYCCGAGGLDSQRIAELRDRNVAVIEFPDDSFAFVPALLDALAATAPAKGHLIAKANGTAAHELERYVLLCLQFSPVQESRLVLVCKAVILEQIAKSPSESIPVVELIANITQVLGQESDLIRQAANTAISELSKVEYFQIVAQSVEIDAAAAERLSKDVTKALSAERLWVQRILRSQANRLSVDLGPSDEDHAIALLDESMLVLGRDAANLLLFNRPPEGEIDRIDEITKEYCNSRDLGSKNELYRKTLD